jgi:hypothetical protein
MASTKQSSAFVERRPSSTRTSNASRRCDGRGRQGARRPDPPPARRRPAQARRPGLRVRACAAVRHLPPSPLSRTTSRSCATPVWSIPSAEACGRTTTSGRTRSRSCPAGCAELRARPGPVRLTAIVATTPQALTDRLAGAWLSRRVLAVEPRRTRPGWRSDPWTGVYGQHAARSATRRASTRAEMLVRCRLRAGFAPLSSPAMTCSASGPAPRSVAEAMLRWCARPT